LIAVVAFFANLNQSLSVFMVLVPPTFRDKVIVEGESSHQLSSSIPELLKVTNTDHWQVWDRQGPLHENLNLTCSWVDFRPATGGHHVAARPMCVVPQQENDKWVSEGIRSKGRWWECDSITSLILGQEQSHSNLLYVDIGANIGSCVMQVITTTNAMIVAFEPDPRNQFYLTSTLAKLSSDEKERIHLFPIALGQERGNSTIHVAKHNRGNAVVGHPVPDFPGQEFLSPMHIHIESLDDIIADNVMIDFLKMDAQGFECNILRGMPRTLNRTKQIWYELEYLFLDAQENCSGAILWNMFENAGFLQFRYPHRTASLKELPKGKTGITDTNFYASNPQLIHRK
jgi:FkbM family methyltransferase